MAYISREKALVELQKFSFDTLSDAYGCGYSDCLTAVEDVLNDLPTADVVEVKKIEIIRDDLKWWLETNSEKGVVHIPKYVVENMIAKIDGERRDT